MEICDKEICTGCAACANICKKNAIDMLLNDKGFLYPQINEKICISCGICSMTCPQNHSIKVNDLGQIYAALCKNDKIRANSSSGGIFSVLAEHVLAQGGIVFGAAFRDDMTVGHTYISDITQLECLRGSKYVQSEIGSSYQKVKSFLKDGKPVLFTGTPCQIDALKNFLKVDYDKLITIDLLCHGTPSPMVFKKFLDYKEAEAKKKIINVLFRFKYPGWQNYSTKLCFEDGMEEYDNSFVNIFLGEKCLRQSCHKCKYTITHRVGDITLGDFWSYKETAPEHIENDDLGISFVSINSNKGKEVFAAIRNKIDVANRTIDEALLGNKVLQQSAIKSKDSDDFWKDIQYLNWGQIVEKYKIESSPKNDWMSVEDRAYYSKPYKKRHMRHKIHCWKIGVIEWVKNLLITRRD